MTTAGVRSAAPPRRPALPRPVAMRLAAQEYGRFVEQLRDLAPADWRRPTACAAWDVHATACHVLGMAEFAASLREQLRQARAARRAGGLFIDALTALQVAKHVERSPDEVVVRLDDVAPRAVAGRRRVPGPLRRVRMPDQPVDERGDVTETWTFGYLLDVILTRDTWMHRCDVAAATGLPMTLTAEHDGVLVADIATEWATRHGRPCALVLTGPAGGRWSFPGDGGAEATPAAVEMDAVEFARTLSGRGSGTGLLATRVPF